MGRRLIDADKLKQHNAWWANSVNEEYREFKVIFDQIVDAQPTVAEPVKHGHWIWEKVVLAYTCSLCHHFTYDGQPNYCPNCGARMDEVEE